MKYSPGRENFAVIHPWGDNIKIQDFFFSFRVWTTGQHSRVWVCSSVWSFQPRKDSETSSQRGCILVWEKRLHISLISTAIPGEQVFIFIPDKSLNKNKRFGYSSKEAEKIYNPSGRSLSSISHEALTVFSCEAGKRVLFFYCSSDHRRLDFCVELWECGSRRRSVDTENKVGLDRFKALHNDGTVKVCSQLQLL